MKHCFWFFALIVIWQFGPSISSIAQNSKLSGLDPQKAFSQYTYDFWNIDNGLPDNVIQDILKTSDGYIWIATLDGLARYDGIKFDYFDRDQSDIFKQNQEILSLFEDNQKNLWIGTNGAGFIRYKDGYFDTLHVDRQFKKASINCFAQTSDGIIWVGSTGGLAKIENDTFNTIEIFPSLKNLSVNNLFVDREDNLWISSTTAGLIKKSASGLDQFTKKDGLINNSIRTVYEDSKGQIWIGTERGVMKLVGSTFINVTQENGWPQGVIHDFVEDERGNIFIASDFGLIRYFDGAYEFINESNLLPNNIITSLMDDKEVGIWLGTLRGGVIRISNGSFYNYGTNEGVCNNIINTIYEDGDVYWIGTENGISKYEDNEFKTYQIAHTQSHNRVKDFLRDHQGQLWVATYGGLYQITNDLKKVYDNSNGLPNNMVRCLLEDNENRLWVGTSDGIAIIDDDNIKKITKDHGLINTDILTMQKDRDGKIWIGSNGGGLSVYNNGKITNYTGKNGLSARAVFNIYFDRDQLLWLSTEKGVFTYDGQIFQYYSGVNEIIRKSVFQTLEDENHKLWFTSAKGIFVVKKSDVFDYGQEKDAIIDKIKIYDKSYGLRSNSVTGGSHALKDGQGKFWFPTLIGISVIDPNNIRINQNPPKVAIEKVLINGLEVSLKNFLHIEPGERNIEIHYTGLNYIASEKIKFKFKLENLDKDWVNAGVRRVAYYNNIPPGNYTFKVKAANDDGKWNEQYAAIDIVQGAYFYKSRWFYAVVGLVILALGVFAYSVKIRNIQKMNEQLSSQVEERTRDLKKQKEELQRINSTKDKLLSIISHDLKGPLNSTKQMLHLLGSGNLTHEELQALIGNITQDVGLSVNLLDNLLNWARSQMQGIKVDTVKVDIHEIVEENFKLFNYNFTKKGIEKVNQVPRQELAFADYEMVKLVMRNLIANAIKFTPEGGEIMVSTQRHGRFIEVAVHDTGIGISEENQQKLFQVKETFTKMKETKEVGTGLGLLLSKEFIEKNGGEIWVESKKNEGSIFKFTLQKYESNIVPLKTVMQF